MGRETRGQNWKVLVEKLEQPQAVKDQILDNLDIMAS